MQSSRRATADRQTKEKRTVKNQFSPGPAGRRNQATLRHPERSIYRCFRKDLAGFTDICRAGPNYADRQGRKKTGLSHLSVFPSRDRLIILLCPPPVKTNISRSGDHSALLPRRVWRRDR